MVEKGLLGNSLRDKKLNFSKNEKPRICEAFL